VGMDAQANSAAIGPVPLAAAQETTLCVTIRMNNPVAMMMTHFQADLAPGSHHLIVYRSQATTEKPKPAPCQPFSGLLGGTEVPILLIQNDQSEFQFPPNVGLQFEAQQMLKLEEHYINTGSEPIEGSGSVHAQGLPLDQAGAYQAADFGFWGTTKITIPAKQSLDSGMRFQAAIPDTTLFAVMPHQHRMGTRFRIWQSAQEGDVPDEPLVDNSDWSEPPIYAVDPPITFQPGAGLSYRCEWENTSDATIIFGESALQEMCFLVTYYYPSHGFDPCFDGNCLKRN
jgi:hypothetical protein